MPLPAVQGPIPVSSTGPVVGVLRVLIIAATFSDQNNTESLADLKHAFFGEVGDYYKEASYGAVTLQGDVLGWYKLNYVRDYYGKNCIAINDPDCSGASASWKFANDAWVAAQNAANLTNYDYYVFVHPGTGQESTRITNDIWSVTYLGGLWIRNKVGALNKYAILPEFEARGAVPMGVYAHEFAHLMGLPDLYDTGNGNTIMGPWSLMDKGIWNGNPAGSSPAHLEAWSKIFLGWISSASLGFARPGTFTNFTVIPTEVASNGIHAIEVPISSDSSQYYLVELRQRLGFDSALPSAGILITSVNEKLLDGRVTVVDANPNVAGLKNATWSVGQTFIDDQNNIAISITGKAGNSYLVAVNRLGPLPDLAIERISTQPATLSPNTTVTITVNIANLGTLAATNVPVQVTLDGQQFAYLQVSDAPNANSELTLTWKAFSGRHTFKFVIDPADTLTELSKANNVATLVLDVGPTIIITVPLSVVTGNATTWVKVNGVIYHANASAQVAASVVPGSVTLEVQSAVSTSPGVRQLFVEWSDGSSSNPRQIAVISKTAIAAIYKTQYLLTVDRNGGVASTAGWYDANSTVTVTATSPSNVTLQKSRLMFTNWSGDTNSSNPSLSLFITKPISVRANWKLQYYLTVLSRVGAPEGSGWYDAGTPATISVQSAVGFQNNTRYMFAGWNGTAQGQGPTGKLVVSAPMAINAQWTTQYLVQVDSIYGNPQGAGWYDAGTNAQISIAPQVDQGNRTRRIFNGWSGDYSNVDPTFTLNVNAPKILSAKWVTQYQLTFKVSGVPNSTVVDLKLGSVVKDISLGSEYRDWFDQGQEISPATNQTIVDGFIYYQFAGWKDSGGSKVNTPVIVEGPREYTATYSAGASLPPIPGFPWESVLAGLLVGFAALALLRKGSHKNARTESHKALAS
jgi:M6 family metalloprotease-like protein